MPYRFRDARIQSGKNLAEAAEELFVSKTTLSNWESGRRVPSVEAIEKLADLYGVSVDYLLGRTDQLNPLYEVSESVDPHMLQFLHECPVYVNQSRWGLVDAVNHKRSTSVQFAEHHYDMKVYAGNVSLSKTEKKSWNGQQNKSKKSKTD